MERMAESIMNVATTLPEGVPLAAKGLWNRGSRAAVDPTRSRLAARGELPPEPQSGDRVILRGVTRTVSGSPAGLVARRA